jgi:hypothetical protein
MPHTVLRVEGNVSTPRVFDFAALEALPGQIPDVGALIPGREGSAVQLRTLLESAGVSPEATHITLHATDGQFSASVPLEAVIDRAVVVYGLGQEPLPESKGGPLRFLIADVDACALGAGEVDACASVKFLGVIQATVGLEADTRPNKI